MTETTSGYSITPSVPITDANGDVWNFGLIATPPNYKILKNGTQFVSGSGTKLAYNSHTILAQTSDGQYWKAATSSWPSVGVSSSGATITATGTFLVLSAGGTVISLDAAPGHVCFNGVADTTVSNASTVLFYLGSLYYENSSSAWFHNLNNTTGNWVAASGDPRVPPVSTWAFITPGTGSFKDTAGNTYTVTSGGDFQMNATNLNGGGGTGRGALLNGVVWGQDSGTGNWYIWNATANAFQGPQSATASGAVITDGKGFLLLSSNKIATLTGVGGEVAFNGTADGTTSGVGTLLTFGGSLYYENGTPAWFKDATNVAGGWATTTADPRTAGGGTGPGSGGGTLAIADLSAMTGHTAHPELFGVSTGGLGNSFFADASNSTLQADILALNLPLLRINARWMSEQGINTFSASQVSNFVSNLASLLPTTCKIVFGVQTNTLNSSTMQTYTADLCTYWQAHAASGYNIAFVECMNEMNGVDMGTYNSCFSGMVTGAQSVFSGLKGTGTADSFFDGGRQAALIAGQSASTLGMLNWHTYGYGAGSDSKPDDRTVMLSNAMPNDFAAAFNNGLPSAASGTYAAGLPGLMGEWNIENSASNSETRTQTPEGACFLVSTTMKIGSTSAAPAYGAWWDIYNDSGAGYNLISDSPSFTKASPYYTLKRLIAAAPGDYASCTSQVADLLAWATVTGNDYCIPMVNANTSAQSGTVSLAHIPGSSTGNVTIYKWECSAANPNGSETTITLSAGVTPSITVPAESVVILSTRH